MTTFARVISFLFCITLLLTIAVTYSHADYIIKPVPETYSTTDTNLQLTPLLSREFLQQVSNSFGRLLGITPTPAATPSAFLYNPPATTSAQISTESAVLSASDSSPLVQSILDNLEHATTRQREEAMIFNPPSPTPTPYANDLIDRLAAMLGLQSTQQYQPSVPTIPPTKRSYKIALLGDSMIDTLGRDLSDLRTLLTQNYPDITFALLNYGQGATDLESGYKRLTTDSTYLETYYPPLLSLKPDIIVIESFAYNHWSGSLNDLNRQWSTLGKMVDTIRSKSPDTKIIIAATIGPNSLTFGDGKLNWGKQSKWDASEVIKAYLNNAIGFGNAAHLPVVDAFHPSLGSDGNGLQTYINQGDHIHPSHEGAVLFSQKIVDTIKHNYLINN